MRTASFVVALAAAVVIVSPARAQAPAAAPAQPPKVVAKPKYARDLPAKFVKEAKITESAAAEAALKAVPGGVIEKMELEKEDGKFIYSYDIKTPGKSGIDEVHVDAMTGTIVGNAHETPADQKAEAAKDAKAKAAPPKPKKP